MTPAWTTDSVTTDLARAVHYTLLWGLEGVVLQTVGGAGDRVPFVNEAALRARLAEADLPVVAVMPGLFDGASSARAAWLNDLTVLEDTAAFCRRIGCGIVRVGALGAGQTFDVEVAAEAFRQAGDVAARHGLRLAVRNDADTAVATGADLADLLGRVQHDAVGADWRPVDALASGEDPADGVEAIAHSGAEVVTVGARDGRVEAGVWEETAVGEGDVGWDEQAEALADAGFDGPLVLDALPGPPRTHGLRAATALVQLARRTRTSRD